MKQLFCCQLSYSAVVLHIEVSLMFTPFHKIVPATSLILHDTFMTPWQYWLGKNASKSVLTVA